MYDSIIGEELIQALLEMRIPAKLVRMIPLTMKEIHCMIRIKSDVSETRKGLRQGNALVCLLFNLALESAVRESGIHIGGTILNRSVPLISYADDIDLVGQSYTAVSDAFLALDGAARRIGLLVNEAKTKYMRTKLHHNMKHNRRWL